MPLDACRVRMRWLDSKCGFRTVYDGASEIFETHAGSQEVARWVAQYIKTRILGFKPTPERPFGQSASAHCMFFTSSQFLDSPPVEMVKKGELSFRNVITFNMDEYVELPRDHPQSYHSFMWTHLFQHIDILPENVHILDGNAADLAAECARYEAEMKRVGGIELFMGGMGTDGHIAFNEPGSSLQSRTRVKTLAYETIVANSRFFDNDINKVPKMALTVGVGTIMDARELVLIISGQSKAVALEKCLEQGVNHMYTLSAIQMHPCACVVCDEDATGELRVRTVRYFQGLEKVHMELLGHKDFYRDVPAHKDKDNGSGSSGPDSGSGGHGSGSETKGPASGSDGGTSSGSGSGSGSSDSSPGVGSASGVGSKRASDAISGAGPTSAETEPDAMPAKRQRLSSASDFYAVADSARSPSVSSATAAASAGGVAMSQALAMSFGLGMQLGFVAQVGARAPALMYSEAPVPGYVSLCKV